MQPSLLVRDSIRIAVSRLALLAVTVFPLGLVPAPAMAQVRIVEPGTTSSPAAEAGLEAVYQQGRQLEEAQQWGEAVSHYEDALKQNPQDRQLRRRHDAAKMHYDLGRRYNDRSFRQTLTALDQRQVLDLYDEVLLKIDTHHVDEPNWRRLVARGAECLSVALDEKPFRDRHLAGVSDAQIAALRRDLQQSVAGRVIRTRRDARHAVVTATQLARHHAGLPAAAVVMEFVSGAVGGLDTYSAYLTGDQLRDVYSQIDGNFVGLGIELKSDGEGLLIMGVIGGSPASQAGIVVGDRITSVDGQSTQGLSTDEAANLLQGPEGTSARLVVLGADGVNRLLNVERKHVDVPSVDDIQIVDEQHGVGYLRLVGFQRTTSRDLDRALLQLHRQGMRSLIIDLRGNPGGLLTASVEVADRFVNRGTIVSTRGRSKQEDYDYSARQVSTWRVPLVVLIDENSASASEIFAAAIRDHRRGTIVGHRSYGKGSVQGIFPLSATGAGLRLTTAKFYSPTGKPISNIGVSPDVVVREAARPVMQQATQVDPTAPRVASDVVLDAGIEAAQQLIAKR
ncbi:MAG: S41 family peptidase [Planctomycetota bacterium]|nr:MAG: S41 family peptidase [Planctomycetota bacterium]REJ88986.1 MAG: S41 family peptidase [Planctomycetota bacterium]